MMRRRVTKYRNKVIDTHYCDGGNFIVSPDLKFEPTGRDKKTGEWIGRFMYGDLIVDDPSEMEIFYEEVTKETP